MLRKWEIKRFNRLANNENTVIFTSGNKIDYIYDKVSKKRYFPKYELIIER